MPEQHSSQFCAQIKIQFTRDDWSWILKLWFFSLYQCSLPTVFTHMLQLSSSSEVRRSISTSILNRRSLRIFCKEETAIRCSHRSHFKLALIWSDQTLPSNAAFPISWRPYSSAYTPMSKGLYFILYGHDYTFIGQFQAVRRLFLLATMYRRSYPSPEMVPAVNVPTSLGTASSSRTTDIHSSCNCIQNFRE